MTSVAQTILQQLGGNKFIAMTGAKNFTDHCGILSFKLPRRSGNQVNLVSIYLDPSDTYTIVFKKHSSAKPVKIIKEVASVYADMLQKIFTEETGLYTKL